MTIAVPPALAASQVRYYGEAGRAWVAALPDLAAGYLDRWQLTLAGPPKHGVVALVLPVLCRDGTPAVLKLQPVDEDHPGEATALRVWDGDGAVRLLDEDPQTWTLLLERLDPDRSLADLADEAEAVRVIAGLLGRLNAHPAPPGIRRLSDVAAKMVADVPSAVAALGDDAQRRLVRHCADAVAEVVPEAGDRLLHWDLHYENVLAGVREDWLAIDPKPLAGDPGFEILPALHNRWEEIVASGDVTRAVLRRFDAMVDLLGLDRQRAVAWTLGRVLQNALWNIEDGENLDPAQIMIASALSDGRPLAW